MKGRSRWAILAAVACLVFAPSLAVAQTVVVPNSLAAVRGGTGNQYPFNCGYPSGPASQRYQQVYLGTEVGSGLIREIRFRHNHFYGYAINLTILDVTITLSTTIKPVDNLSSTFSDNVGADVTTVFSGNLSLSTPECSADPPSPCPFDIVIPLTTSFPFDGSAGNLLLDVTIPTCPSVASFFVDAQDSTDSISSTYTDLVGDSSSAEADITNTRGLVTQFVFDSGTVPVPAPTLSTWGLAAAIATLLTLGLLAVRRRSRV